MLKVCRDMSLKMNSEKQKTFIVKELRNLEINGQNYVSVIRKVVRKMVSNAKKKKPNIDIFEQFKNITLTIYEKKDGDVGAIKEQIFIFSLVPIVKKSLYYNLEYNIEVYKKLALI